MKKIKKLTIAIAITLGLCNVIPMYASATTSQKISSMRGLTIDLNDEEDEFTLQVSPNGSEISSAQYKPYIGSYSANIVSRVYVEEGNASDIVVEIFDVQGNYSERQTLRSYRNTLSWDNLTEGHRYRFRVYNNGSSYAELRFMLL